MLAMFRREAAAAQTRFIKGYSSLRAGSGFLPLSSSIPREQKWIDGAWENALNYHKVYVTKLDGPIKVGEPRSEILRVQTNTRFWVSRFLRGELLPTSTNWPTQFWHAPNGDEVAVTSWKSNGFSLCAYDGRTLCLVVRPDESRDLFGHTLATIQATRATGKDPTRWADPLPLAYGSNAYAQQMYALLTPEATKVGSNINFISLESEDLGVARLNGGRIFVSKGDPGIGIPALPRTFARDIHYWTDGVTVVFVVDKLIKPPAPISRSQIGNYIGGFEETDARSFKRFGRYHFNPANETARYKKELNLRFK